MTALFRYHTAMLLRSQRWLPPVLLYGIILAVGVRGGEPVLDSLGVAAAALLPVTAWLVRICVTQEPDAARAVTAAASGMPRAHLAALLAAAACATALGTVGTVIVTAVSAPKSADGLVDVAPLPAGTAGLLAALVSLLVGTSVGALCSRPLLRGRGWSLALTALFALLALVTTGSPAKAAVTGLVTGSRTGAIHTPGLPLAAAALLAAVVAGLVCVLGVRRA
ncbi:ABC transporter [Streptomyces sp. NPDC058653]|uniref:ABC transporter n=1 Tax=Streptomyces sp. NPDC058653 TaxID=3346576 RepID=UPI003652C8DE